MISPQAYINLIYSLATFPLGIFYFVFLVSGLALGVSLAIIWVGIPILMFVGLASLVMGSFERFMAIHLLKENIPELLFPSNLSRDIWSPIKENITNPVLWKSPIYLFLKFPLGLASFTVLVTMVSLTLALLTLPITYESMGIIGPGIFFGADLPAWHIDSMGDALLGSVVGLILWPVTLHVTNALTWVHAKFAKLMLSADPMEGFDAIPQIY
jgi:hypothetical protein